jgi:hypothetical protein
MQSVEPNSLHIILDSKLNYAMQKLLAVQSLCNRVRSNRYDHKVVAVNIIDRYQCFSRYCSFDP